MAKKKTKLFNYDVDVVEAGKFAGLGFLVLVLIQEGEDIKAKLDKAIKWIKDNIVPISLLLFLALFGRLLLAFIPAWGLLGLAAVVGAAWYNGAFEGFKQGSFKKTEGGVDGGGGDYGVDGKKIQCKKAVNANGIDFETGKSWTGLALKSDNAKAYPWSELVKQPNGTYQTPDGEIWCL